MTRRLAVFAALTLLWGGAARPQTPDSFTAELPPPDPAILRSFAATESWLMGQSRAQDPLLRRAVLFNLGWLWEHAPDTHQQRRSLEWYRQAQAAGSAQAELRLLSLARAGAFGLKPDAQTKQRIEGLARQGLAEAYVELGYCLQQADCGQPADIGAAFAAYREASRRGLAWGTILMGALIRDGKVGTDRARAQALFRQAIAEGTPRGYSLIGQMYEEGLGVVQDGAKARTLYEQGAALGDTDSMLQLGSMLWSGTGGARDIPAAIAWLSRALDAGELQAGQYLGRIYEDGVGVRPDYEKAAAAYRRAIVNNDAIAMNNLGLLYLNSKLHPPLADSGLHWLQSAFDRGLGLAACNLGLSYRQGIGLPVDLAKAREWYLKGAKSGVASCEEGLGSMAETGQTGRADPAEAARWYSLAAQHGSESARQALARLGVAR